MEVDAVSLGGSHVGAAVDAERLHHLRAGPPCRFDAERGTLVAVELQDGQILVIRCAHDLVQGRVDEDSCHLAAALHRRADLFGEVRLDVTRASAMVDQPDRPRAEGGRVLGVGEAGHAADLDLGHAS
jgi:hypothetical protein